MELVSPQIYLSALSNLMERVTAKKYMLTNTNFSKPLTGKYELEINSKFKSDLGFGLNEVNSIVEIKKYEDKIDLEFSKIAKQKILKYPVEDEITLLKLAKKSSKEYLDGHTITLLEQRKFFLDLYKINIPTLISLVKTSKQVFVISTEEDKRTENVFILNKTKHRNINYNVFAHLNHGTMELSTFTVANLFYIQESLSENYSPVRLFLTLLNKYGVILKINGVSKKFFLKETIINKNIDGRQDLFEVGEVVGKPKVYVTSFVKPMNLYTDVAFVYGINETEYSNDFLRRDI